VLRIEYTDYIENGSPKESRVYVGKPQGDIRDRQMIPPRVNIPVHLNINVRIRPLIDFTSPCEDERRRLSERLAHQTKCSRRVLIVRVQKSDDLPARPLDPLVPGVVDAAIRLREHFQMRVLSQIR